MNNGWDVKIGRMQDTPAGSKVRKREIKERKTIRESIRHYEGLQYFVFCTHITPLTGQRGESSTLWWRALEATRTVL